MDDAATPAPFAVGYGNGLEPAPCPAPGGAGLAGDRVRPRRGAAVPAAALDRATVPVTRIDLQAALADPDATTTLAAPAATAAPVAGGGGSTTSAPAGPPPFAAHPVGAAHPRRRFGRGLVIAGAALLVAGAGIGAVAAASGSAPSTAAAAAPGPVADPTAAAVGALGGRAGAGVHPTGAAGDLGDPGTTVVTATPGDVEVGGPGPVLPATPGPTPTLPPVTTTAPPTTAPPPSTVAPTTAPPTTAPPTTAPAGPVFGPVTVPATAGCPGPASDVPLTLTWSVTGATSVTLSIDGPGAYRTYSGGTGTETVNFACSTPHTYLLTAHGPGATTAARSFTVTPS